MSEKFRLDFKIGFLNMFYTKCINVIIDSIGPSIILRSICTHRSPSRTHKNILFFFCMRIKGAGQPVHQRMMI